LPEKSGLPCANAAVAVESAKAVTATIVRMRLMRPSLLIAARKHYSGGPDCIAVGREGIWQF